LVALPLWQRSFYGAKAESTRQWAALGVNGSYNDKEFLYFLYYLNLFPVASELFFEHQNQLEVRSFRIPSEFQSLESARGIIHNQGRTLVMDLNQTIRFGDWLPPYIYLVSSYIKGLSGTPKIRPVSAIYFVISLAFLLAVSCRHGLAIPGIVAMALIGSNPMQVFEIYIHYDNVFSFQMSTALLVFAIGLSEILSHNSSWKRHILHVSVSAAFIASAWQIRPESAAILGVHALLLLAAKRLRFGTRLALIAMLFALVWLGDQSWGVFFRHKIDVAKQVVADAGGNVIAGPVVQHHILWHNLWCGLGDFDEKYGYVWDDRKAFDYAESILRRRGIDFGPRGTEGFEQYYYTTRFWDGAKKYPVKPEDIPEYIGTIRDKILSDISNDPLWYLEILRKRLLYILFQNTPVRVAWGGSHYDLASSAQGGLILIGATVFQLLVREWRMILMLWAPMFAASSALLVWAKGNAGNYSVAHLLAIALVVAWISELVFRWRSLRPPASSAWSWSAPART
jgi:hypothetical protein